MNKPEEELYTCSCGHLQKITPHLEKELSRRIIFANCPSCSKGIVLFKCRSCGHPVMMEAHTVKDEAPGAINLTCPRCDSTDQYDKP